MDVAGVFGVVVSQIFGFLLAAEDATSCFIVDDGSSVQGEWRAFIAC